jgi:glycosyltransferase involved in cell wall biosynthesis
MLPYIKKFNRKGLIFKGHIPQHDLYKYYSQGNIFALMSIQDGFGMVLVQAMSCGLPIITTVNTGGPDLITKNGNQGFILNIRDVDGLIENITYIYENNLSYEMGQSAKLRVSQGYTWEDYGNRYYNFIHKLYHDEQYK